MPGSEEAGTSQKRHGSTSDTTALRAGFPTAIESAIAGCSSGALTAFVTSPMDVVKTRFQVQHLNAERSYRGVARAVRTIYAHEGGRGFFHGLYPTMLGLVPNWGIYFLVYAALKERAPQWLDGEHAQHVASAAVAGACASLGTSPLWVVKTRLQTQEILLESGAGRPYYRGTFHAFRKILREEGIRGFYKGIGASMVGVTHVMVQFPLYEYLKAEFQEHWELDDALHAVLLPVAAASCISKVIGSITTYPHEVLRSRMQVDTKASHSLFAHARELFLTRGARGFYSGMGANLLRVVPSSVLTLVTYEMVLRRLMESRTT